MHLNFLIYSILNSENVIFSYFLITELPIDIPSVVVLEYMHNVCLGVMKKLLSFWVKGKKPVRLVNSESIYEELLNLKFVLPTEFNCLPRS